jgi:tetratricopeptide (TPR) repeat protein/RIO-like serine/threonine protein kinase
MSESPAASDANAAASATHTFDQLAIQQDPLLGQVVGNYHLLARAGEGASGTVYRARDTRLDRTVAVKFLKGIAEGAARTRFEQEARALARAGKHPGVVAIYAWGEHAGRCYLAMEYLPETAAARLALRPQGLELREALAIGLQCADALAAVHAAGVVHGDIKPSNILLETHGAVAKLGDFGLAHLGPAAQPQGGSPAYLAPECAAGQPPTFASDIYALAATLFTLMTGKPPVEASSVEGAMDAARSGKLRPLSHPALPGRIAAVLAQAMAMDPAQRPASAREFAHTLRAAMDASAPTARRDLRVAIRPLLFAAAVLIAAFGVILFQSLLPGAPSTAVLADARLSLNRGAYEAARAGFEKYLNEQPDSAEARYGLAYAFLLEGDHARAAQEFARLARPEMRREGEAAVAYMASGAAARPTLEQAAQEAPSSYAGVLLAMLDMLDGKFEAARARLDKVRESDLGFEWQRRQYLQTLGQLLYKSGDYAGAEAAFKRLEAGDAPQGDRFAASYAALAQERRDLAARKDLGEQLARLRALRESRPLTADADPWTSRPLSLWIAPVDPGKGVIAVETGLADVLPWRLSRAMASTRRGITTVERNAIADILAEQEIAAAAGDVERNIQLGRVVGARLLLTLRVTRLLAQELLHVSLVDTETTLQTPVGEYAIARTLDPDAWLATLLADIEKTIDSAYPLRGRVHADAGGPILNLGTELGLREGMVFEVVPEAPGAPAQRLRVSRVLGERQSSVSTLEGTMPEVPDTGWRVQAAGGGDAR